jgi:hypothetical protein
VGQAVHRWSGSGWVLVISLAVFPFLATVQGPAARGSSPSPLESQTRRQAIRQAVEQCAALVEKGDHRKDVPMLAELRRALAKQAKGEDDSARAARCGPAW